MTKSCTRFGEESFSRWSLGRAVYCCFCRKTKVTRGIHLTRALLSPESMSDFCRLFACCVQSRFTRVIRNQIGSRMTLESCFCRKTKVTRGIHLTRALL